jgi:DNA-binding FrmR family transcriptional regulator
MSEQDEGKRVRDRLRRAEGQVRAVQRMLDERRPCEDVVTQLLAARSALDEVVRLVLVERISECIATLPPDEAGAKVARAIGLLVRA